jgi:hypothetical protein
MMWFSSADELDTEIRTKFGPLLESKLAGNDPTASWIDHSPQAG